MSESNTLHSGKGKELVSGLEIGEIILEKNDDNLYYRNHKVRERKPIENLPGVFYNACDDGSSPHQHFGVLSDEEGREIRIGDESVSFVTTYGNTRPYDVIGLRTEGVEDSRTVAYKIEDDKFQLLDFAGIELQKPYTAAGDNIDSSHIRGLYNVNPADTLVDGKYEKVRDCTLNKEGQKMVLVDSDREYDIHSISFYDEFRHDIQNREDNVSPSQVKRINIWYYTDEHNPNPKETSISFMEFLDNVQARDILDASSTIDETKEGIEGAMAA